MAQHKHKHKKKQGFRYFMQPPGNSLVFLDSLDKREEGVSRRLRGGVKTQQEVQRWKMKRGIVRVGKAEKEAEQLLALKV